MEKAIEQIRFDYTQHCLRAQKGNFTPFTFEQFKSLVTQIKNL